MMKDSDRWQMMKLWRYALGGVLSSLLVILATPLSSYALETSASPAYREFPIIGSRVAVWVVAQLHLMFAAFVVGVPIFAVIVEYIGVKTKDPRYDRLAHEFTKLLSMAFSTTATFGAILLFFFIGLYPAFFHYMTEVFFPTMVLYVFLFFGEAFSLYLYYYGWEAMIHRKGLHLTLGVLLNVFGLLIMVISNTWATFMMSPAGIDDDGKLVSLWAAINNFTWWPVNIHRFIANISFGGSIVGAYAAFRFLSAKTQEERAHYDWMGYIGNVIGVSALIPLPFAGYWLAREIYGFSQQMGITMMGGIFSWLFIIQAVLIGALFLAANYYLWLGMGRIRGAERYRKYTKFLLLILTVCFLVWLTPHSLVASLEESRRMGGAHHPLLGVLGVMSAKNTVVNLMILTTFLSFLMYMRANKIAAPIHWARRGTLPVVVPFSFAILFMVFYGIIWISTPSSLILSVILAVFFGVLVNIAASKRMMTSSRVGNWVLGIVFLCASSIIIGYGIYGYYVEAIVRIGFSIKQVSSVLVTILLGILLFILQFRDAQETGAIEWGKMSARSQYALFLLAIS
ncbi:MAG: cytochrome ubiquinol oxidase subunit I, partial [Candidatus Tectomicrobia bacterium]|nr:cytochrome ubiquinol oxidase subunit I [Candidatus Tectomicrobia bacterium]